MIRKGIISGACLNHVITSHYIKLQNIIILCNIVCYAKREVLLIMKLYNNYS